MSEKHSAELSIFQRIAADLNNSDLSPRKRERIRDEMETFGTHCGGEIGEMALHEAAKIEPFRGEAVQFEPDAEPVAVVGAPEARLWARTNGNYDLALGDLPAEVADKFICLYEDYLDAKAAPLPRALQAGAAG